MTKFEVNNSLMPADCVPKITSQWSPTVIFLPTNYIFRLFWKSPLKAETLKKR